MSTPTGFKPKKSVALSGTSANSSVVNIGVAPNSVMFANTGTLI